MVAQRSFPVVRAGARVALYAAGARRARRLGSAVTDADGDFSIGYRARPGAVLYVVSTGGRVRAADPGDAPTAGPAGSRD